MQRDPMAAKRRDAASLRAFIVGLLLLIGVLSPLQASPTVRSFTWQKNPDRVSAELKNAPLDEVLELIAEETGWDVFIEPDSSSSTTVRFKDRPASEALKLLLGKLSYAIFPQPHQPTRLLVFRTGMNEATQLVPKKEAKSDTSKPIPNQLVVTIKPGVNIDALAKKLDGKVIRRLAELNTYLLEFETAEATEKARKALAENPDVEKIQNNYHVEKPPDIQTTDMTMAPLPDVSVKSPTTTDCDRVTVALIDTAFPETAGTQDKKMLPAIHVAGDPPTNWDKPPHGSAMAAAITRGSQNASINILPVDVYGQSGQANTFDVATGIYRAIAAGAKIINLSLGSDAPSPILTEIIRQGRAQDVIFIAAAGNKPTTNATYPAADPSVIAVTASDRSGQLASYANRGDFVDVIAPGSTIFSFGGQNWVSSGTSVSTAYVSGLAASLADPCAKSFGSVENQIRQNLGVKR